MISYDNQKKIKDLYNGYFDLTDVPKGKIPTLCVNTSNRYTPCGYSEVLINSTPELIVPDYATTPLIEYSEFYENWYKSNILIRLEDKSNRSKIYSAGFKCCFTEDELSWIIPGKTKVYGIVYIDDDRIFNNVHGVSFKNITEYMNNINPINITSKTLLKYSKSFVHINSPLYKRFSYAYNKIDEV